MTLSRACGGLTEELSGLSFASGTRFGSEGRQLDIIILTGIALGQVHCSCGQVHDYRPYGLGVAMNIIIRVDVPAEGIGIAEVVGEDAPETGDIDVPGVHRQEPPRPVVAEEAVGDELLEDVSQVGAIGERQEVIAVGENAVLIVDNADIAGRGFQVDGFSALVGKHRKSVV